MPPSAIEADDTLSEAANSQLVPLSVTLMIDLVLPTGTPPSLGSSSTPTDDKGVGARRKKTIPGENSVSSTYYVLGLC